MRRILAICIAIVFAIALPGSAEAARPQPRVAIVVGPVEGLTDLYRSIGAEAAREARRWTSDVVVVASPDATWPAVKRALRGASVVVYLGHGNGFPSPYRDALFRPTQNGLGLNPVAGGGDDSHQYFGEEFIGRDVHLAPGAVVLLNHLCYASGNSEPGLPEGSLEIGRQRVDNYAAGWLSAGAGAVIADTFGEPGPYLRAILSSDLPIGRIWRNAPNFHDHIVTFPSQRTPGAFGAMDPTQVTSGFNRSIVLRPGFRSSDIRAGAGRVPTLPSFGLPDPGAGSLATLGVTFRAPSLSPAGPNPAGLVAGTKATLRLPIKAPAGGSLPKSLELGLRWDALVLEQDPPASDVPAPAAGGPPFPGANPPSPNPAPASSAGPLVGPTAESRPHGRPIPNPSPSEPAPSTGGDPPAIDLLAPEALGTVVTPTRAPLTSGHLKLSLDLPTVPGIYRLTTLVHDAHGVAFDAATQALVPALKIRISRPLSVAYGVARDLNIPAGASLALPVRLANDGSVAWALAPVVGEDLVDPLVARSHTPARLIARWLSLGAGGAEGVPDAITPVRVDPGSQAIVLLTLTAPSLAGDYLVVLDIASPLHGSLAASGVSVGQIRVSVSPATTPAEP